MRALASLGIDLGTGYVRAAVLSATTPVLVSDSDGTSAIPAVVCFDGGAVLVGQAAVALAVTHPESAIWGAKWFLGRAPDDPVLAAAPRDLAARILADPSGRGLLLRAGEQACSPGSLVAHLLRHVTELVARRCGVRADRVVMSVPPWLPPPARETLIFAAGEADLGVERVVSDAEAMAVGLPAARQGAPQNVAVVSVGAGGLSASILRVSSLEIATLSSAGDGHVGGDEVDRELARLVLAERWPGLLHDRGTIPARLRQTVESMKRALSDAREATAVLPYLPGSPSVTLDGRRLAVALGGLLARLEGVCARALAEAGLAPGQLDGLYATGGMTHAPAVRACLEQALGREAVPLQGAEGTAFGAARFAGMLARTVPTIELRHARPSLPPGLSGRPSSIPPGAPAGRPATMPPPPPPPLPPAPRDPRLARSDLPLPHGQAASAPSPALRVPVLRVPAISLGEPTPGTAPASVPPPRPVLGPVARAISTYPAAAVSTPSNRPPGRLVASEPPPASLPGADRRAAPAIDLRGGPFVCPADAAGMLELPLLRSLRAADLSPVALPVLLVRLLVREDLRGVLTLASAGRTAQIHLADGRAHLSRPEHHAATQAFLWREGAFSFEAARFAVGTRMPFAMPRLAIDGLRVVCRLVEAPELEVALGARFQLAPVLRGGSARMLAHFGLGASQSRFVQNELDGVATARALTRSGLGRHGSLELLLLLTLFGVVDWVPSHTTGPGTLSAEVEARARKMLGANHFEALGAHWSATADAIEEAYHVLAVQLDPAGAWAQASPDACATMRARIGAAYAVLRDPALRIAHRRAEYQVDFEAAAYLLEKRADALTLRRREGEASTAQSDAAELSMTVDATKTRVVSMDALLRAISKPTTGGPKQ